MKSILQKNKKCYICGTTYGLELHHVIHGTSNRKNSDREGLVIWLCWSHHKEVHEQNPALDDYLKRIAQTEYEKTHTRDEWRKVFGKSWL